MLHPIRPTNPTAIITAHTHKGCVHWWEFCTDERARTIDDIHPCVVIGRNSERSSRVIISPISGAYSYIKNDGTLRYGFHVLLKKDDYPFLEKDSVILLDQVFTVPKETLCEEWYMGKIDNIRQIDEAIMQNYDLIQTITEIIHEVVNKMVTKQAVNK